MLALNQNPSTRTPKIETKARSGQGFSDKRDLSYRCSAFCALSDVRRDQESRELVPVPAALEE